MISGGLGMWCIPTGWLHAVFLGFSLGVGGVLGFEFLVAVGRKKTRLGMTGNICHCIIMRCEYRSNLGG